MKIYKGGVYIVTKMIGTTNPGFLYVMWPGQKVKVINYTKRKALLEGLDDNALCCYFYLENLKGRLQFHNYSDGMQLNIENN